MPLIFPNSPIHYSKLTSALIVLIGLMLLWNILWTLDKGLIFHDEAWELLHYQNGAYTIDYSNWHRVLRFMYHENLLHLRVITVCVISFSAYFLGYSVNKFFQFQMPSLMAGFLFIIFQFFLNSPVKLVPSYTNMNFVLINISISFLFLFLFEERENIKRICLILCAFFISTLPFILVTNSLIIGLLLGVIFVISPPTQRVTYSIIFILSLLIYPIFYFTLIQTPTQFWEKYREATHYLSFDSDYGLFGIVKWHARLLLYFVQVPLFIAGISLIFIVKNNLNRVVKNFLIIALISLVLYQLYQDISFPFSQFPVTLWYVLFFLMLYAARNELMMNKASLILILFCATLPYFASLGTVVRFQLKAASFFPYLAISILCLIRYNYSIKPAVFFYTLFLVGVLVFFSYNFRTGWSNYNVRKQTQHFTINDAKGHLYLEPYRVNELNALKPYLKDNDSVMVSHENVWGHVYLNNAKPVYLPFRFKEKYFHYFIEKYKINAISITYVEMKRKPFPGSFKDFLKALQSDRYSLRIVDLDEFNVYLFVKN